jgi:hypothetical protein
MQIGRDADQVYGRNAQTSDANTADAQWVFTTVESQYTAAATGADDESRPDDSEVDSAGLCKALRRHSQQHSRRSY